MNTYFAKFGSYHSVGAREVYISISSQRHPGWRQDILLLKSLHKFCDFFFGHLNKKENEITNQ
jgi:hypothetical protein